MCDGGAHQRRLPVGAAFDDHQAALAALVRAADRGRESIQPVPSSSPRPLPPWIQITLFGRAARRGYLGRGMGRLGVGIVLVIALAAPAASAQQPPEP